MRRAITLIELLVVIVILTVLTAAVIPMMTPAVESRKLRESARGISTYFASARASAANIGRPAGVEIVPLPNDPSASMLLRYVEAAPPYSGSDFSARATVRITSPLPPTSDNYTLVATLTGFDASLVDPGDMIQFNHQGHLYYIDAVGANTLDLFVNTRGSRLPWSDADHPYPLEYTIHRKPRPGSRDALQLPDGVVVNLTSSGEGETGVFAPGPVIVTFGVGGTVDAIYISGVKRKPIGTLCVLIGKSHSPGIDDFENLWVGVNLSGTTLSAEIGVPPIIQPPTGDPPLREPQTMTLARSIIRTGLAMSGR